MSFRNEGSLRLPPLLGRFGRRAAGDVHADGAEDVVDAVVGRDFGEHLAVVGGGAEGRGVERDLAEQLALDRGREFLRRDLGPLGHAELVDDQQRLGLGRAAAP